MPNIVLEGANRIREEVVEPFRIVDWLIWDVKDATVIYADDGSIFIFDLAGKQLHQIMDGSYTASEIESVTKRGGRTDVRVKLDVQAQVTSGLLGRTSLSLEVWQKLFDLASMHTPTQQRIWVLRPTQA